MQLTKFSKSEIQFIYRDFKLVCFIYLHTTVTKVFLTGNIRLLKLCVQKSLTPLKIQNLNDLLKLSNNNKFLFKKCPNGILTEKSLAEIYSQIFSCGDTAVLSKHLFSAMNFQNQNRFSTVVLFSRPLSSENELNFKVFLITLSSIMRGTIDEKIKWLFNFYDLNKDGRITPDVSYTILVENFSL
jgi:Ca2+-binding EF-hand superfamily protein